MTNLLADFGWTLRGFLPLTRYPYRGERTACPVCGHDEHEPVSGIDRRLKRLPTVACLGCGLLYTNPMPTEEELSRYYRRLYRFDYQLSLRRPSARHLAKRSGEAQTRVARISDLLEPGSRTLDFGAGSGEFVATMLEKGFDAYGFAPGENYGSHARGVCGDRISVAGWREMHAREEYDLVTSFHVFEHLRDPAAAFASCASWLKTGGLVYVEVPDAMHHLRAKGFGSLHFAHVVGFNRYNVELAAALAGLEPVRVVGATAIVFRKTGRVGNIGALAAAGAALARDTLHSRSLARTYATHHMGKVGLALRS